MRMHRVEQYENMRYSTCNVLCSKLECTARNLSTSPLVNFKVNSWCWITQVRLFCGTLTFFLLYCQNTNDWKESDGLLFVSSSSLEPKHVKTYFGMKCCSFETRSRSEQTQALIGTAAGVVSPKQNKSRDKASMQIHRIGGDLEQI